MVSAGASRCGPRCEFHARGCGAPCGPPGLAPARGRKPSDEGREMPLGPPLRAVARTATALRSLSSTGARDSSFCICFFGGAWRGAVWSDNHRSNSFCASSRSSFRTSARLICNSSFWTNKTKVGMDSRSGCASTSEAMSGSVHTTLCRFLLGAITRPRGKEGPWRYEADARKHARVHRPSRNGGGFFGQNIGRARMKERRPGLRGENSVRALHGKQIARGACTRWLGLTSSAARPSPGIGRTRKGCWCQASLKSPK